MMDTLLSCEAMGFMNGSDANNAGRSHDNDNMANLVGPDYIHTTHSLNTFLYLQH